MKANPSSRRFLVRVVAAGACAALAANCQFQDYPPQGTSFFRAVLSRQHPAISVKPFWIGDGDNRFPVLNSALKPRLFRSHPSH